MALQTERGVSLGRRLAILSNVTVEPLARMFGSPDSVWTPPGYGAWMQTALEPSASLAAFDPEILALLVEASRGAPDASEVERAVRSLERAFPRATVIVPDLADLADEVGSAFFDERLWSLAGEPWSLAGLEAIRDEIVRLARVLSSAGPKVLAVDFDGVLWDGVVGEDGAGAVTPRVEFQRTLRRLRERGVLLVGLSRNNRSDVEPVWGDPRMILKPDDFVSLRVDWNAKSANLAEVARELNLGTDAFLFVDDNPVERAEMSARLPDVAICEWPIAGRRLERLHFPHRRQTDEDRARTEQYRAESDRRAFASAHPLDDYLAGLEMVTEIHPAVPDEFPRLVQLAQKSNQFNVLTNRRTAEEIARFASDPSHILLTLRVRDRFGDLGLVAFVHAAASDGDPTTFAIADFVMSCRAMNRRLEFQIESELEKTLAARGVTRLRATWRRTPKNEPVRELFERLGFALVSEAEDTKTYERALETESAERMPSRTRS